MCIVIICYNQCRYRGISQIFPTPGTESENVVICLSARLVIELAGVTALASNLIPNLTMQRN